MKKILFLIITLLFSSLASAENEAVYDETEGSIEIPVLSVKGQTKKFSVTLQQEDAEDMIFTITDATPDPEVESSTNEATYDPETGVVVIPSVMVLEEGNPSIKSYSVELQLTEESIFKISQTEPILALPTNSFNGIPSETLDTSVAEKVSSGSSRCTGNPSQNIDTARQNFKTKCGEPWNDQKHVCDYKPDGFHCSGNVSASTTPAPTNPTTSNPPATNSDWCTGTPDRNRDVAKRNFRDACGQTWNDQQGHICESKSDGWHCSGNRSPSGANIPTTPYGVKVHRWHSNVVIIEWDISVYAYQPGISGFKIFRNGDKIGVVNRYKSYFYDRNARGNYRYQVVAVNDSNMHSPSSDAAIPRTSQGTSLLSLRNGQNESSRVNDVIVTSPNTGRTVELTNGRVTQTNSSQTISFDVQSTSGESLGTMEMTHDGGNTVTVTMDPHHGSDTVIAVPDEDFNSRGPRTTAVFADVPDVYPNKPTPPPSTNPPRDDDDDSGSDDDDDDDDTPWVDRPGTFCPKGSSQEGENRCIPNDKLSDCVGPVINEQQPVEAKVVFGSACKTTYNDQLGHQCEWVSDPQGWRCFN